MIPNGQPGNGNGSEVEPTNLDATGEAGVNTKKDVEPGKDVQGTPENQGTNPPWMAQLPKEIKADKEMMAILSKNPTIGDYVKNTFKKPGDNGNAEDGPVDYDGFDKKLGEDADPFGTVSESLKKSLQENKVSKEGAEKIFDAISEARETAMKDFMEKGIPWCEKQLKDLWKDKYDENHKAVTRGTKALMKVEPDLMKELDKTGASINPAVARIIAIYGKSIKEDSSVGSNESNSGSGTSPKVPVHYPD